MPKVEKSGLEQPVDIHLRVVRNGVTMTGHRCDTGQELEYVYSSMDEALKEIKGLVSVLSEESKKTTEKDLDEEEMRINNHKGEEDY